jgi:FlgD Ig-like domain/Right handed beta helix region
MKNLLLFALVAIMMIAGNLVAEVSVSTEFEIQTVGPDQVLLMNLHLEIIGDAVYSIKLAPIGGITVTWCDYDRIFDENDEQITCSVFSDNLNEEIVYTLTEPITESVNLKIMTTVFEQNEPTFQFHILNDDDIQTSSGNVNGDFPIQGNLISVTGRLINVMGDNIQNGINSAQNGDVVLVQPDEYYENLFLADKNIKIISMNEIWGYGYGVGGTIIDGSDSGRCLTATNSNFEIAGFVIQNGNIDAHGGGISLDMCHDSLIRNCSIINNRVISGSSGGGIHVGYSNDVTISNVELLDNIAIGPGGGISCHNSPVISVIDCFITGNNAVFGGGIFATDSQILLENNYIGENHANHSGGGIFIQNATFQIYNNEIYNNVGYEYGGGICAMSAGGTIADCLVTHNTSHYGGGISMENCYSVLIQNGSVSGNSLDVMNGRGGGINCLSGTALTIDNVTINGNSGNNGAAIFIDETDTKIRESKLCVNDGWIYDDGGIIIVEESQLESSNVTIADNTGTESTIIGENSVLLILNSILWDPFVNHQLSLGGESNLTVAYSDVKDGEEGILLNDNSTFDWSTGNISEDPLFLGPQAGNYHLSENSPCIDAGINYFEWNEIIFPINDYNGLAIDIGRYESDYPVFSEQENIPGAKTQLLGNFPNPFNPSTTIKFDIANKSDVELAIYNIKGQKVQTLVNGQINAGLHTVIWNGKDQNNQSVASGIYFYKLTSDSRTQTKRMMLLK